MWEFFFDFFVKFNFFKYLKFNKNCFKKYIYSIIKIPNYFSHILSQMFEWTAKFQIQMLYRVRDTKKRSCLRGKKKLARILMHLLPVQIEGTAEAVLRKSNLFHRPETQPYPFTRRWCAWLALVCLRIQCLLAQRLTCWRVIHACYQKEVTKLGWYVNS
jgi:hypothetical protein